MDYSFREADNEELGAEGVVMGTRVHNVFNMAHGTYSHNYSLSPQKSLPPRTFRKKD